MEITGDDFRRLTTKQLGSNHIITGKELSKDLANIHIHIYIHTYIYICVCGMEYYSKIMKGHPKLVATLFYILALSIPTPLFAGGQNRYRYPAASRVSGT